MRLRQEGVVAHLNWTLNWTELSELQTERNELWNLALPDWTELNELSKENWRVGTELNWTELKPKSFELWTRGSQKFTNCSGPDHNRHWTTERGKAGVRAYITSKIHLAISPSFTAQGRRWCDPHRVWLLIEPEPWLKNQRVACHEMKPLTPEFKVLGQPVTTEVRSMTQRWRKCDFVDIFVSEQARAAT